MSTLYQNHIAIIDWAASQLSFDGHSDVIPIVETPWSSVLRINTAQGAVYLKQAPGELFIEAEVIQACRHACGISFIPKIIATNKELSCFLMSACGDVSLRTLFAGQPDMTQIVQGVQLYREMQRMTVPHVDAFLAFGIPDWRLECLPQLYQNLACDDAFLQAENVPTDDIKQLQDLTVPFEAVCKELAGFNISACLSHSDIHDNNMLIDTATQQISIIDLGECAVDHPFLSLAACLTRMAARYQIVPESPDYHMFQNACFSGFLASDNDMQQAIRLTHKLLPFYSLLVHMRLMRAGGDNLKALPRMQGRIKTSWSRYIQAMIRIDE